MMTKETDDITDNEVKRNRILLSLDSVHRSLLLKNMQYEGDDDDNPFMNKNSNEQFKKYSIEEEVFSENSKTLKNKNNTKNIEIQTKTYNNNNNNNNYKTANSEISLEMENQRNRECEQIKRKCENGVCICFSSDSDDVRCNTKTKYNNNNNINNYNKNLNNQNRKSIGSTIKYQHPNSLSGFSSDETKASSFDDQFHTSYDCSNTEDFQYNFNKSDSIILRSKNRKKQIKTINKQNNNRQCFSVETGLDSVLSGMEIVNADVKNESSIKSPNLKRIKIKIFTKRQNDNIEMVNDHNNSCRNCLITSPSNLVSEDLRSSSQNTIISENHFEEDEYHDCTDFFDQSFNNNNKNNNASNSSASFYEDTSETISNSIHTIENDNVSESIIVGQPAIHIIQEVTESMVVTSNVTINKEQIKLMQGKQKKKKKITKIKKKIIDDNFCNEILDQTLDWNRLFETKQNYDDDIENNVTILDSSFNESFTSGKLEASPKYSGKVIGDLMKRRLKKAEKIQRSKSFFNAEQHNEHENFKVYSESDDQFTNVIKKDRIESNGFVSTDSGSSRTTGPKKPPRTFASNSSKVGLSSNTTVECGINNDPYLQKKFQKMELKNDSAKKIGWNFVSEEGETETKDGYQTKQRKVITPTCPTFQQLGCHIGWIPPDNTNKQQTGEWIFVDKNGNKSDMPQKILNMLNYDETNTISHYSKAQQQQQQQYQQQTKKRIERNNQPTKEDIDTVDSVFRLRSTNTPRKKIISINEFDNFTKNAIIKSTPEKYNRNSSFIEQLNSSIDVFGRSELEQQRIDCNKFLNEEKRILSLDNIQNYPDELLELEEGDDEEEEVEEMEEICKKCFLHKNTTTPNTKTIKKLNIGKNALKRTKTFLEAAAKKKIPIRKFINNAKVNLKKFKPNSSDSELYLTPKKSDTTTNMNRFLDSAQKKLNKSFNFTTTTPTTPTQRTEILQQNEWTCTSCKRLTNNTGSPLVNTQHENDSKSSSCNTTPKKKILNFNENISIDNVRQNYKSNENSFDFNRFVKSPKQKRHDFSPSKFKLPGFHLSPRRLFKTTTGANVKINQSLTDIKEKDNLNTNETYKSYHENDHELMALMGEFLAGIRNGLEESMIEERELSNRLRRLSTSSEILDKISQKMIKIDMHDEPIYEEIKFTNKNEQIEKDTKNNKGKITRDLHGNYYMANNNPNAIYSSVKKNSKIKRTKSLNNLHNLQETQKNNEHNNRNTTTPTITIDNNFFNNEKILKNSNLNLQECNYVGVEDQIISTCVKLTDEKFQQTNIDKNLNLNQIFIDTERGINNLKMEHNENMSDINFSNNNEMFDEDISSYDASKFLRGALGEENNSKIIINDGNINKKSSSFNNTMKSSSSSSSEGAIGFDTVDLPTKNKYSRYESIDEISTIPLKPLSVSTPTHTPSKHDESLNSSMSSINSPNNSDKHNNSTEYYRSFKQKLRNSFRKGKNYIKNERKKLVEFFDDKDKLNQSNEQRTKLNDSNKYFGDLDQYKSGFNDRDAEKLYHKITTKLNDKIKENINYEKTDQYLLNLINQISYQRSIRNQLSNAVSICRNTIEFESSPELIEAERLLLLSNLKESAAKRELIKNDYGNDDKKTNNYLYNGKKGTVLLGHFEFHLNDVTINDTLFNYFYICVCSYKEQVISTIAKERNGNKVIFNNCSIQFNELEPDYEIRVEVYVLSLRKSTRNYSHESKYHLNREPKSFLLSCPSTPRLVPGKLLKSSTLPKKFVFDAEFSQFKTQGFTELTTFSLTSDSRNLSNYFRQVINKYDNNLCFSVEDLKEFKLNAVAYNSNLTGRILINLRCEILMENNEINGFLNVGEKIHGSINWNRHWCQLDGITMFFWNYPHPHSDEKPIFTIDLTQCITDSIQLVDRTKCAKPRTFSIEVFGRNNDPNQIFNNNCKLYFLSADGQIELNQWMTELNNKTKFLKDWNI